MSDCDSCRAYKQSVKDSKPLTCNEEYRKAQYGRENFVWFSPSQMRYCRPQVLWYLVNCDVIRDGKWTPEPTGSNYTGTDPSIRNKAVKVPSRSAEMLASEMDWRLDCCATDGKLLEAEVIAGRKLSYESIRALNYISGYERKINIKKCPYCGLYLKMYLPDSQQKVCTGCGKIRTIKALKRKDYSDWKSHRTRR